MISHRRKMLLLHGVRSTQRRRCTPECVSPTPPTWPTSGSPSSSPDSPPIRWDAPGPTTSGRCSTPASTSTDPAANGTCCPTTCPPRARWIATSPGGRTTGHPAADHGRPAPGAAGGRRPGAQLRSREHRQPDGQGVEAIRRRDQLADGGVVLDDFVPPFRIAQWLIAHDSASDDRVHDGRIVGVCRERVFHLPAVMMQKAAVTTPGWRLDFGLPHAPEISGVEFTKPKALPSSNSGAEVRSTVLLTRWLDGEIDTKLGPGRSDTESSCSRRAIRVRADPTLARPHPARPCDLAGAGPARRRLPTAPCAGLIPTKTPRILRGALESRRGSPA